MLLLTRWGSERKLHWGMGLSNAMMPNTLIPMTDANHNFPKVVGLVDEQGTAVILKIISPDMLQLTFLNMMVSWSIEKT